MNEEIRTLESHGVHVEQTMTTPSRPGKKPRPVWVVRGNVFGLESFFRDNGGKKYRGAWSFFENPSDHILEELDTRGRQSFAEQVESTVERKEARIERYEGYSENAEARASAAYGKASSILSVIPPGQPILVGHHSERRHRRDLAKADNAMRKSVEESKKSEYYDYKVRSLSHQVTRAKESRLYLENQLKKATRELKALERWAKLYTDQKNQDDLRPRIAQAQEKVAYWKKRLEEREQEILAEGGQVASPATVKPGDLVRYGDWYPVVRVNRNTVTISHWLGIPHFTYKLEYSRITEVRTPNKV